MKSNTETNQIIQKPKQTLELIYLDPNILRLILSFLPYSEFFTKLSTLSKEVNTCIKYYKVDIHPILGTLNEIVKNNDAQKAREILEREISNNKLSIEGKEEFGEFTKGLAIFNISNKEAANKISAILKSNIFDQVLKLNYSLKQYGLWNKYYLTKISFRHKKNDTNAEQNLEKFYKYYEKTYGLITEYNYDIETLYSPWTQAFHDSKQVQALQDKLEFLEAFSRESGISPNKAKELIATALKPDGFKPMPQIDQLLNRHIYYKNEKKSHVEKKLNYYNKLETLNISTSLNLFAEPAQPYGPKIIPKTTQGFLKRPDISLKKNIDNKFKEQNLAILYEQYKKINEYEATRNVEKILDTFCRYDEKIQAAQMLVQLICNKQIDKKNLDTLLKELKICRGLEAKNANSLLAKLIESQPDKDFDKIHTLIKLMYFTTQDIYFCHPGSGSIISELNRNIKELHIDGKFDNQNLQKILHQLINQAQKNTKQDFFKDYPNSNTTAPSLKDLWYAYDNFETSQAASNLLKVFKDDYFYLDKIDDPNHNHEVAFGGDNYS